MLVALTSVTVPIVLLTDNANVSAPTAHVCFSCTHCTSSHVWYKLMPNSIPYAEDHTFLVVYTHMHTLQRYGDLTPWLCQSLSHMHAYSPTHNYTHTQLLTPVCSGGTKGLLSLLIRESRSDLNFSCLLFRHSSIHCLSSTLFLWWRGAPGRERLYTRKREWYMVITAYCYSKSEY